MVVKIRHLTHYHYTESVQFTPHRVLLRPRESPQLRVLKFDLQVAPPAQVRWMTDPFENHIAMLQFREDAADIRIEAEIKVEVGSANPFDFIIEPHAERYPFAYSPHESRALKPFMEVGSPANCNQVLPWLWKQIPELPPHTLDLLTRINHLLHERFTYQRRDEEGIQSPDETIQLGSGSCRDFARLFIEICRQLGFAARFVSGYLYDPSSGGQHFNNVTEGAMHAWMEVHLPGAGWKGFDPTNGMLANEYFIPCAVASEPKLTSPIQGSYYHMQMQVPSTMEVSLLLKGVPADPEASPPS